MIRYFFAIAVVALFFLLFRELWRALTAGAKHREVTRAREREVAARTEVAMKTPGATPDHPIAVTSAALVEAQATSLPCVVCDAAVTAEEHSVTVIDDEPLRVVRVHCRKCGHRRDVFVRVAQARVH